MVRGRSSRAGKASPSNLRTRVARAFSEFLGVPSLVILGFLLLAVMMYMLDQAQLGALAPIRSFMRSHLLGDVSVTRGLLSTIAGSIITLTSITFSILLLAVQQSAAAYTSQVFDQFLRRPVNQVFFGFFVGTALYTLIILATVRAPFTPVLGATVALALTAAALYLLIVLFYTTIDQMRADIIIAAIQQHVLAARERQKGLLRRMRAVSRLEGTAHTLVRTESSGYITHLDLRAIEASVEQAGGGIEVRLLSTIGSYVAYHDPLAELVASSAEPLEALAEAVRGAIQIQRRRDIRTDPAYGIQQLETIAWTSISEAKANLAPGLLTTRVLRDVLARWSEPEDAGDGADSPEQHSEQHVAPIVYHDDVPQRLAQSFEALVAVATSARQYQIVAEIARAYAATYERLPADQQRRAESLAFTIVATLTDLVPTSDLHAALIAFETTLAACGRETTALALQRARASLESVDEHQDVRHPSPWPPHDRSATLPEHTPD